MPISVSSLDAIHFTDYMSISTADEYCILHSKNIFVPSARVETQIIPQSTNEILTFINPSTNQISQIKIWNFSNLYVLN